MIERKPVQVRELRDNLAAYLKQAEEGTELIVMSRDRAVARLGPHHPLVTSANWACSRGAFGWPRISTTHHRG
jgi:antitoxin (DNA-binding transcriptional repressor) of toxin-antitoxin stability system